LQSASQQMLREAMDQLKMSQESLATANARLQEQFEENKRKFEEKEKAWNAEVEELKHLM